MTEQELKEKIYKKFKKEIIALIEITEKTKKKAHFDLSGLSDVYNISMSKAPEWFAKWNKTEFRPLVAKVDKNTEAIDKNTEAIADLTVTVNKNTEAIADLTVTVNKNTKAIKRNYNLIKKYHPE